MDTRKTHILNSGAMSDGTTATVKLEGGRYHVMLLGGLGNGAIAIKGRPADSTRSFVAFTDGSFNAPNVDNVLEVGKGTEVNAALTGSSGADFDLILVPVPEEGDWR